MPQYLSLAAQGFYEPFQYLAQALQANRARNDMLAQQQRENAFRQQGLDISKQGADLAQKQFADTHAMSDVDLATKKLGLTQAQKAYTLATHDPSDIFSSNEGLGALGEVKRPVQVTEPGDQSSHGPGSGVVGNTGTRAAEEPGANPDPSKWEYVPSSSGGMGMTLRRKAGVPNVSTPDASSGAPSTLPPSAPTSSAPSSAAAITSPTVRSNSNEAAPFGNESESRAAASLTRRAAHTVDTPLDELTKSEQDAIARSYQDAGSAQGVKISRSEALRAYRMQQIMRNGGIPGLPGGGMSNMYVKSAKFNAQSGMFEPELAASPFGSGGTDLETASKAIPFQKNINEDEGLKTARNIVSAYSDMLKQAALAEHSKTPGVNDQNLVQKYVSTFAPNAKFNPTTHELIGDTKNIPDRILEVLAHWGTGQNLLHEHREAILEAARANAENAASVAMQSTESARNLASQSGLPPNLIPRVPMVPPSHFQGDGSVPGSSEGATEPGSPQTVWSKEEKDKLPPGTPYTWGPTGQAYRKK